MSLVKLEGAGSNSDRTAVRTICTRKAIPDIIANQEPLVSANGQGCIAGAARFI